MARKASLPPQPTQSTTLGFEVDVNIIRTLINAQAGSLEKALMEAVSNSMDAGATALAITADRNRVVISDNGKGLSHKDEILSFFGTFGFDHSQLDRSHGRFGIGRGQMFCYGKNTWRTGEFALAVDINQKGLKYDLDEGLAPHQGMEIAIDLYEPLGVSDLYNLEEQLRRLVKYAVVPITYNGKQLNELPQHKKWEHEIEEAWFNPRSNGGLLIYSQGLLVQEMNNYRFGIGGVLVTKPGHALTLNMARNDILQQGCPVWKNVSKLINKVGAPYKEKAARQNTLTSSQRKSMAKDFTDQLSKAKTLDEKRETLRKFMESPLFTLTNNKHVHLNRLLERQIWGTGNMHDKLADKAMQHGAGWVVTDETLERFGVETMRDLRERLIHMIGMAAPTMPGKPKGKKPEWTYRSHDESHEIRTLRQKWNTYELHDNQRQLVVGLIDKVNALQLHETTAPFKDLVHVDFQEVPTKELSGDERVMLNAIRRVAPGIRAAVDQAEGVSRWDTNRRADRQILVMKSDTMNACTNGSSLIWIERRFLKQAGKGLPAFMDVVNLLTHEYTHGNNTQNDHGHDQDFFETFHNAVRYGQLTKVGILLMAKYAMGTKRKPTVTLLKDLNSTLDPEGAGLFQGQGEPDVDEVPPVPAAAEPITPPTPAKRRRGPRA